MRVEKWLLFDGVALGAGGVSPGDVEGAAAVVADFADSGLAFGDGAAVPASEAAHAIVLEFLVEMGIGFDRLIVEDGAEGGHWISASILQLEFGFRLPDRLTGGASTLWDRGSCTQLHGSFASLRMTE
jgi:hypothetical protein